MLPRFEVVARRRPVRLVLPDGVPARGAVRRGRRRPGSAELTLACGPVTLAATYDDRVALHVTTDGRTTSTAAGAAAGRRRRSRRWR